MAQQTINNGAAPNDGTGDTLRAAFAKVNSNFIELYNRYRTSIPATATSSGTAGQWAADANYLYICTATNTWRRVAIASW